ncbi:MAG: phospholipase D-like domain-containing protein [Bacteroidales bacterium]|nr:phospholipase D-like domain-containing protein [Bacteroidales bacterium]
MSVQLIYHTPESMAGGISPFDATIMQMVAGREVRLACPYLGLTYLNRLTQQADHWRLITDVPEWLRAMTPKERQQVEEFIAHHRDQIHHCQDLHAKVVIAGPQAMTGSANFTQKGMTGRVEVSVLFADCEPVDELRAWFDLLWSQTAPVVGEELRRWREVLPTQDVRLEAPPISCRFPGVAARLSPLPMIAEGTDVEERLLSRLRLAPNRQWMESWLDLAQTLLETTGLSSDDRRLVISLPNDKEIPIIIGSRIVLMAFRRERRTDHRLIPDYRFHDDHQTVDLILPASYRPRFQQLPRAAHYWFFKKHYSDEQRNEDAPICLGFTMPAEFTFPAGVRAAWLEAAQQECDRHHSSSYRRKHQPQLYSLICDPAYRRQVLDVAFSG